MQYKVDFSVSGYLMCNASAHFWLILGWVVAVNKGDVFLCRGAAALVVQCIRWHAHYVHLQFYCHVHVYYHARRLLIGQIHHIMLGMRSLELISKQIWCTKSLFWVWWLWQLMGGLTTSKTHSDGVHKKLLSCRRAPCDLNLTQWESPFLYSPWQRRIKSPAWPRDWKHSYHRSH